MQHVFVILDVPQLKKNATDTTAASESGVTVLHAWEAVFSKQWNNMIFLFVLLFLLVSLNLLNLPFVGRTN